MFVMFVNFFLIVVIQVSKMLFFSYFAKNLTEKDHPMTRNLVKTASVSTLVLSNLHLVVLCI